MSYEENRVAVLTIHPLDIDYERSPSSLIINNYNFNYDVNYQHLILM